MAMEVLFNSRIIEQRALLNFNSVWMSEDKYDNFINKVLNAKLKVKKEPTDYNVLKKYDVLEANGIQKLIVPLKEGSDIIYYVHDNELYKILHKLHVSIGHGGRDRMMREVKKKYKNITYKDVMLYLNLCEHCQQKQKREKPDGVITPLLINELNSRCQIDLIDFQSRQDGSYKFIMVYQDQLTKFCVLKPLKSKKVQEVSNTLIDVFTLIGAPSILQSNNGREFVISIIDNLKHLWPELKIVHGKPRDRQSVEREIEDIKNMLTTWLQDNQTTEWSKGLRFIQLMKNKALNSGIRRSPYEALFGCPLKIGLPTSSIPPEVLANIKDEVDLERAIESPSTSEDLLLHENRTEDVKDFDLLEETNTGEKSKCTNLMDMNEYLDCGLDIPKCCLNSVCSNCFKIYSIKNQRKASRDGLQQKTKRMKLTSKKQHPEATVMRTAVRIPIPIVDRDEGDLTSILVLD